MVYAVYRTHVGWYAQMFTSKTISSILEGAVNSKARTYGSTCTSETYVNVEGALALQQIIHQSFILTHYV